MSRSPDMSSYEFPETGIQDIRIEQAQMLNRLAPSSCRTVLVIIFVLAAAIWATGHPWHAAVWITASISMVTIVYVYAARTNPENITAETYQDYLRGHSIISGMTGLVWSGFACYHIEWDNPFTVIIAGTMTMIISAGGTLPTAIYRREYVVLATCALIPFSLFTLLTAPGPMRFFGLATLTFYALCMGSSARAEINTRDGILARRTKKLTARLIEQNETIIKASEEKARFFAATSHDLSQPLHAQGYFIQALRAVLTEQRQIDLIDKVEDSWRSQRQLLRGIVDITRLDSGAVVPNIATVRLKPDLEKLVGEFTGIAKSKNIDLRSELEDLSVHSDPVLLTRIVRNLLSNAVKFTPENGSITVTSRRRDDMAEILVKDNGPGIPAEKQDAIFAEYVQLDKAQNTETRGLGLGLSIVKRLVKLLDIRLELQSTPGTGTDVRITLPIDEKLHHHVAQPLSDPAKLPMSPLIVVVDDEIAIREGMASLLTDWGCQTISAGNSQEAITLLSVTRETPRLLIVDKRLGHGENGIHLIQSLREEVNETVPAILMTGDLGGFGDITPGSQIHLMPKPVDPDDLKRIMKDVLASSTIAGAD